MEVVVVVVEVEVERGLNREELEEEDHFQGRLAPNSAIWNYVIRSREIILPIVFVSRCTTGLQVQHFIISFNSHLLC